MSVWLFSCVVLAALAQPAARPGGFGSSVALLGDIDGDGWREIAVCAPSETFAGAVYVFSGRTGEFRVRWSEAIRHGGLASAIGPGGDLDGDGFDDVVVSLWRRDRNRDSDGALSAFSPRRGCELWTSNAPIDPRARTWWLAREASEGCATARFPDLRVPRTGDGNRASSTELGWDADGDGMLDIAYAECTTRGVERRALLRILSARDGSTLAERELAGTGLFGTAIASGVDLDGDGLPEIAVAAPNTFSTDPPSRVYVFRARDLSELYLIRVFELTHYVSGFAETLAFVRDMDGDGVADLVCGTNDGHDEADLYEDAESYGVSDITLFSGSSGRLIARSRMKTSDVRVSAFGRDFDGDGIDEILLGLPDSDEVRLACGRCLAESRPLARVHAFLTLRPTKR
jgi:hypothetical protein